MVLGFRRQESHGRKWHVGRGRGTRRKWHGVRDSWLRTATQPIRLWKRWGGAPRVPHPGANPHRFEEVRSQLPERAPSPELEEGVSVHLFLRARGARLAQRRLGSRGSRPLCWCSSTENILPSVIWPLCVVLFVFFRSVGSLPWTSMAPVGVSAESMVMLTSYGSPRN